MRLHLSLFSLQRDLPNPNAFCNRLPSIKQQFASEQRGRKAVYLKYARDIIADLFRPYHVSQAPVKKQ